MQIPCYATNSQIFLCLLFCVLTVTLKSQNCSQVQQINAFSFTNTGTKSYFIVKSYRKFSFKIILCYHRSFASLCNRVPSNAVPSYVIFILYANFRSKHIQLIMSIHIANMFITNKFEAVSPHKFLGYYTTKKDDTFIWKLLRAPTIVIAYELLF